jgi:signal peptidase I
MVCAYQLKKLTQDPLQDIISEFLEKMWIDVQAFRTPQVRHNKKIYTVLGEDGDTLNLQRNQVKIAVHRDQTERLKKVSMFTFVYSGVVQYYCDRCSRMFTSKNGFSKDPENPTTEVTVVTKLKKEVKTRVFPNYVKVAGIRSNVVPTTEDDFDPMDMVPSDFGTPEDHFLYYELVELVRSRLSDPAKELFSFLLQENTEFLAQSDLVILNQQSQKLSVPTIKVDKQSAAKFLSKTTGDIKQLYSEIAEAFPVSFKAYKSFGQLTKGVGA